MLFGVKCHLSMYAPLNLSGLTTEGEHGPDGGQHFFRHGPSFGVRRLLLTGEGRKHLAKRDHSQCLAGTAHKESRRFTQEPLTLLKNAAEMASAGLTARITSVSFQPVVKPMMKDVMKVV